MSLAHSHSSSSRCWTCYHTCKAPLQNHTIGQLRFQRGSCIRSFPFTNLSPISTFRRFTADSRTLPRHPQPVSAGTTGDTGMKTTSRSWWLICANVFSTTSCWFYTPQLICDHLWSGSDKCRNAEQNRLACVKNCNHHLHLQPWAKRRCYASSTYSKYYKIRKKGKKLQTWAVLGLRSLEGLKLMLWLLHYWTRKRTQFTKYWNIS